MVLCTKRGRIFRAVVLKVSMERCGFPFYREVAIVCCNGRKPREQARGEPVVIVGKKRVDYTQRENVLFLVLLLSATCLIQYWSQPPFINVQIMKSYVDNSRRYWNIISHSSINHSFRDAFVHPWTNPFYHTYASIYVSYSPKGDLDGYRIVAVTTFCMDFLHLFPR